MKHYLLVFVLALLSCNTTIQKEITPEEVVEKKPKEISLSEPSSEYQTNDFNTSFRDDRRPIKIYYDSALIFKRVYVTDTNGADVKVMPNSFYETIYHFPYGEYLGIIEDTNEWYGVKNRSIFYSWCKVYVLKSATGEAKGLKLKPSDLLAISEFSDYSSNKNNYSKKDISRISRYLDLELISKGVFEEERKHAVKYLVNDSSIMKNKNGEIELKLRDTIIRFNDNPTDGESRQMNSFEGNINALNSYLIYSVGYESEWFSLIDKTSGNEKWGSESFPFLSPDGKYIICCRQKMYDDIGSIEIYKVDSFTIKLQMSTSFTKWVPSLGNMFWSSDGCFYIEVYSSFIYQGDYNEELKQYIRLSIKE